MAARFRQVRFCAAGQGLLNLPHRRTCGRLAVWSRDLPGGVSVAEPSGDHGVSTVAQVPPGRAAAFLGARDLAARSDDQRGDVFSHFAGDLRKD